MILLSRNKETKKVKTEKVDCSKLVNNWTDFREEIIILLSREEELRETEVGVL